MASFSQKALIPGLIVTASLSLGAIAAWAQATSPAASPAAASDRFPDIQGYWAQPFIQSLADQNIVAGYPDGTFRPDRPMGRDEFSAITRRAFSQEPVEKEISSGGVYKDVPPDYWAVPAIEASYERGWFFSPPTTYYQSRCDFGVGA
jgi:S-layer homology domain